MTMLLVLSAAVVALALWRPLYGLWLVIGVAVLQDDRLFYETALFRGLAPLPTVFNVRIAGLQLIDWYVLLLLAVAAVCLRRRTAARPDWLRRAGASRTVLLLGAATLPYLWSLAVGAARGNPWLELVQDLQNHLYLLAMCAVIVAVVADLAQLRRTVAFLIAALGAKALVLVLRYVLRVGYAWEKVFRVTLSSDVVLLLVLVAVLLQILMRPGRLRWSGWMLFAVSTAAYFVLFETAGRTTMVLFAAQMALLFVLGERGNLHRVWKILLAWNVALLLYMWLLDPQLARFYWWRISSILQWSPAQYGRDGNLLSNAVKTLEIKNVLALLVKDRALVFGMGQGASWTDAFYPITLGYLNDGYPPGEIRHFSTHLQPLTQLLKMGVAGVAVYWAAMAGILLTAIGRARIHAGHAAVLYRTAALALIPLLFNMSNYVRLYFFLGIIVGVMCWLELWGDDDRPSMVPAGSAGGAG